MKSKILLPILGLASLCIGGCASYTIQPISATNLDKSWKAGKADSGYVFYQPELYFLVTPNAAAKAATNDVTAELDAASGAPTPQPKPAPSPDKSPSLSVTAVYLPNMQKPYRVTTFNFLAKSDFAFNFKDGWQLSSIADKADNTTIANTLAGEVGTILSKAGVAALFAKEQQKSFLLHPKYDPQTGVITGFDDPILFPISR